MSQLLARAEAQFVNAASGHEREAKQLRELEHFLVTDGAGLSGADFRALESRIAQQKLRVQAAANHLEETRSQFDRLDAEAAAAQQRAFLQRDYEVKLDAVNTARIALDVHRERLREMTDDTLKLELRLSQALADWSKAQDQLPK